MHGDEMLDAVAALALGVGFSVAVVTTFLFSLIIRAAGQAPRDFLLGFRPVSDLISQPNLFSIVVAVIGWVALVMWHRCRP